MKKIMLFTILAMGIFVLGACTSTPEAELTPPVFSNIEVNGRSPIGEDTALNPFVVNRNENIRVEIFLSNPDNLPINAVSINGVSYRSHRFAGGTTNSHIIIDFSAGNTIGTTTYVLESVEYSVRGLLQTLSISQTNRYQVEVFKNMPVVRFDNIETTPKTIAASVSIIDLDLVVQTASLRLVDGDRVVKTVPLNTGVSSHEFDELLSNKDYRLEISYVYDLSDDTGLQNNIISTIATTTEVFLPTISIVSHTIEGRTLSLFLSYQDVSNILSETITVRLIEVNEEREYTYTLETINDISIANLKPGTAYRMEIEGTYLIDEINRVSKVFNELRFSTSALKDLSIDLTVIPHKTRLDVIADFPSIDEYDDYESVFLILEDEEGKVVARLDNLEESRRYSFFKLASGYEYTIRISGMVNYGDGEYIESDLYLGQYSTVPLVRPNVTIQGLDVVNDTFDNFFIFRTPISDPDNTLLEVILEVYAFIPSVPGEVPSDLNKEEHLLNAVIVTDDMMNEIIKGENILSIDEDGSMRINHKFMLADDPRTEYLIKVYMSYDMRNLRDPIQYEIQDVESFSLKSLMNVVLPIMNLDTYEIEDDRLTMSIRYRDVNKILEDTIIVRIIQGKEERAYVYALDALEEISIEALKPGASYRIEVEGRYQVDENQPVKTEVFILLEFKTAPLIHPSIELTVLPDQTRLDVIANFPSLEDYIDYESLVLTLEDEYGEIIAKLTHLEESRQYSFFRLWSGYDYTIRISGMVNYGDGFVLEDLYINTHHTTALIVPTVEISQVDIIDDIFGDRFSFNTSINDPDNVLLQVILEVYAFSPNDVYLEGFPFYLENYMINAMWKYDENNNRTIVGENIFVKGLNAEPRSYHEYVLNDGGKTEYLIRVYMSYDLRNRKPPIVYQFVTSKSFVIQNIHE